MPRFLFVVSRVAAQKPTYSTTYLMAALVRQGCAVFATDLEHLTWDSQRRSVARAWQLPAWANKPFAVCQVLTEAGQVASAERLARRFPPTTGLLPGVQPAVGTAAAAVVRAERPPALLDLKDIFEVPPPVSAAGGGSFDYGVPPVPMSIPRPPQPVEAGGNAKPSGAWQPLLGAEVDAAWLRCNFHAVQVAGNPFLAWAQGFEATGKICFNAPAGLWRTTDKSHLFDLPAELRPRGLLSSNRADLLSCIRFLGRTVVLKPSNGYGGEQVFIIERGRFDNLNAILDSLLVHGPIYVQEYLQAAADGDRRILLWNGRPVEVNGQPSIYRRMRAPGDLRNNLHIGGIRARCRFNRNDATVIDGVGEFVRKHGIWLAGVDIIGGKVLEINACAPGGIHNINELYGISVDDEIAKAACGVVEAASSERTLCGAG